MGTIGFISAGTLLLCAAQRKRHNCGGRCDWCHLANFLVFSEPPGPS